MGVCVSETKRVRDRSQGRERLAQESRGWERERAGSGRGSGKGRERGGVEM